MKAKGEKLELVWEQCKKQSGFLEQKIGEVERLHAQKTASDVSPNLLLS